MTKKVFLGNLPWSVTTESLESLLRGAGYSFREVRVVLDRETGRSRGFAFVEFDTPEAASEAVKTLEGLDVEGRPLRAAEANEDRGGGKGGGTGRGGRRDSRRGGRDFGDAWED